MAAVTLTVTLLLLAAGGISSQKVSYEGYQLLSVYVRDIPDVKFLLFLVEKYPWLDFWLLPVPERNSTVLVPPHLVQEFESAVNDQGMRSIVLSDEVQSMVDAGSQRTPEGVVREKMQASGHVIDHYNYHNYSTIVDFVNKLESKYPTTFGLSTLVYFTHEGKEVTFVRVASPYTSDTKPAIIVEAGIHGREWIAPAAILWVMEKMLQSYASGEPTAHMMLDNFDWFVVPVTNPDGYDYSHSTDRMWTKNRRYIHRECRGVDLDRNFGTIDFQFAVQFRDRCETQFYPGHEAFSEPESWNIRNLFDSLQQRVVAYVSVNAYGQSLLVPWSYTNFVSRPLNYEELYRVTGLMAQAISQRHDNEYSYGIANQMLNYAVAGTSIDWVQARKSDVYAISLKLRPALSATEGFLLPSSEIIAAGEELFDSLAVLAKEIGS